MGFFDKTEVFRKEVLKLMSEIDINDIILPKNYAGEYQIIIKESENVSIILKQERLYKNRKPYNTSSNGNLKIEILDKLTDESLNYEYSDFLHIISWDFPERPFRFIVPNNILSDPLVRYFTQVAYLSELPAKSKENQFIYYTDIEDGDVLLSEYPEIIIESKPKN